MKHPTQMNVRDIVRNYLIEHGYNGLSGEEGCCCKIDNLIPCNEIEDCYPHNIPDNIPDES